MDIDECEERLRFTLSDESGVLRVESFDIVDAPECLQVAETVLPSPTVGGLPLKGNEHSAYRKAV